MRGWRGMLARYPLQPAVSTPVPDFELVAPFEPTGDQPAAIERLADGVGRGLRHQVLLGATGTGKSLHPDEPVLVGHEDEHGRVEWRLEAIGPLVDRVLATGPRYVDDRGTEVAFRRADREGLLVVTVDPATHRSVVRPVTAVSRHPSPDLLWTVTAEDGRAIRVTGDHNFVRLGEGARLHVVETTALRAGDWLPLPSRIPAPADTMRRYDAAPALAGRGLDVTGPDVDPRLHQGWRRAPARGLRAPLDEVGAATVAVTDRHGATRITMRHGDGSMPVSVPASAGWLGFLGLFVAEGHVGERIATLTPGPENLQLARDLVVANGLRSFERPSGEICFGVRATIETLRTLCGEKAGSKHLPPFWPSLDDAGLGRLLAGYFEGDGGIETGGSCVSAVTKSEHLASELSYALLCLGIRARLSPTWKRAARRSSRPR